MKQILAPILIALVVGACASSETEPDRTINLAEDKRVGEQLDRLCFTSGINGFSWTSSTSVVLSRGTKDFLVTTRSRCRDLRDAQSLAVDSFSGCLSRGDRLIGFDSAFGRNSSHIPPFPCFVDEIYEWDRGAESSETEKLDSEEEASEELDV